MKASFHNFMTGLIDYAGFFPPAELDIKTALGKYGDYLEGKDGWMLARCIVPVIQLHHVVLHPGFRFSVIVSPGLPQEELEQLSTFAGSVEMVETRLPENADSPERCTDHLLLLQSRLFQAGIRDVQLFLEAEDVACAALAIAEFNDSGSGGEIVKKVGYKLRCGGIIKESFPTPEKVAEAISICCEQDIPIKFTAGMHHPLRNYSPEIEVMQHGFINIFGAALLCWSGNLTASEIAECLGDESARNFDFTEEIFSWKEKTIAAGEIKRLRQSKVISFGSCSFTEPLEGLSSLRFFDHTGA